MSATGQARPGDQEGKAGRLPTVLLVNDLWGYGTVTMAMAISDALEGRAIRIFAGDGPGFELARRGGFDECLRIDTMADITPGFERTLHAADAVVTIMNDPVAWAAVALDLPCVYADCLTWMWDTPPDVPPDVPYFAESFPGTPERLSSWPDFLPPSSVVGPLIRPIHGTSSTSARDILVNFGGLSSPLLGEAAAVAYADGMLRCVMDALNDHEGQVIVSAGDHVLQALSGYDTGRVELRDLDHHAYLEQLRQSRLLITSAGMHALYEASALGVPYMCLPSQNQSGSLAMRVLSKAGIDHQLDWTGIYDVTDLDDPDQAKVCNTIVRCIHDFHQDGPAMESVANRLRRALDADHLRRLRDEQAQFYREQGAPSGRVIADRVLDMLKASAPILAS